MDLVQRSQRTVSHDSGALRGGSVTCRQTLGDGVVSSDCVWMLVKQKGLQWRNRACNYCRNAHNWSCISCLKSFMSYECYWKSFLKDSGKSLKYVSQHVRIWGFTDSCLNGQQNNNKTQSAYPVNPSVHPSIYLSSVCPFIRPPAVCPSSIYPFIRDSVLNYIIYVLLIYTLFH